MTPKVKKIIAREFLIILFCLAISLITFLFIYPYNYFKNQKIETLEKEIFNKTHIADSLAKKYNQKLEIQYSFAKKFINEFYSESKPEVTPLQVWQRLNQIAVHDSIKYKWEHTWTKDILEYTKSQGFSTPDSFKSFILNSLVTSEENSQYRLSKNIETEVQLLRTKKSDLENDIVPFHNQLRTAVIGLLIAALILIFLRYVYYGIKWSLKTLKQN